MKTLWTKSSKKRWPPALSEFADNGSLKSINPMRGMAVITRY